MEDREVLLQLIEDYPNLINSLEKVTNLFNWSNDLSKAIRSICGGENRDNLDVKENLKFLILYLFDKKGFFVYLKQSIYNTKEFFILLGYIKEGLENLKDAIAVFIWDSSFHDNDQVLREKLLKCILRNYDLTIPKEKEMLQEVIYNCKVISSKDKGWTPTW